MTLKFVEDMKADVTTDVVYMMCPMHLLRLDEVLKTIEPGQVLEILTDYDGALEDIPGWCEKTGNEFLGVKEVEDIYKLYIRKRALPSAAGQRAGATKKKARQT